MNLGDYRLGSTIDFKFTSRSFTTLEPFSLIGIGSPQAPQVAVYIGNSATESVDGVTFTPDFDGKTGLNHVRVEATTLNGFSAGTDVDIVIVNGQVDGKNVTGEVVGSFSIENRVAIPGLIADQVWDEALAGHLSAGSTGEQLNNAASAGNPWASIIEGSYTAEDLLRIIASVIAGKTSITALGDGSAIVVFRSITDASNLVTSTVRGSERTDMTLAP